MSDISSISSSSVSASYNTSAASPANTEQVKPHHHHHGGGDKMMGDVTSALSSLGVNVDTSNPDTKSALSSLMHTLMGAMKGFGGKGDGDGDGDDNQGGGQGGVPEAKEAGNGANPFKQGLDSLISALSSGNSSNPTLSQLQQQFDSLTGGITSQDGKKPSLQDFLTSFKSKLPEDQSSSGYMVNTTA
ncbi:hypothetical protein [Aeromonas sp. MdU4]|uniref:hypothetical protein n=1 Tax=Aeromonas sp. MdU4 TaxID=3342819 RepID=UPI0035B78E00